MNQTLSTHAKYILIQTIIGLGNAQIHKKGTFKKVFVVEDEGIIFEVIKGEFFSICIFKKNENVDQKSYKEFEMCSQVCTGSSMKYNYRLIVQF